MRRFSKVVMILVCASVCSIAQFGDIAGVISDSATGEAIPFAQVLLSGYSRGVSANAAGFFLVPRVRAGTCQLSVRAIGYRSISISVDVRDRTTSNLRISLLEEPIELRPVNVVEEQTRDISKIQPSVLVLNQRESRSVPVAVQQDVFRSISILPGIVTTSDVSSQFYVRGGAGDQNLILLDGMRIYSPYHALGIFSIFDSDLIQQSTIYSGAYPAGYGGRLSSVVSLRSRGGRTTSPKVVAGANPLSIRFSAEGPIGENIGVLAHARSSISSSPIRRFVERSAPLEFFDVFAKGTYRSADRTGTFGVTTFMTGDRIRPTNSDDADYLWRNSVVGVTATGLLSERLYVSHVTYASRFEANRDGAASLLPPLSSTVSDLTFHTDATLYVDSGQEYYLGFEFSFPTMEYKLTNALDRQIYLKETIPDVSAWVRTIVPWGNWAWDLGVHLDVTSILQGHSESALQPRVSGSYSLDEAWRLKVAYGRFSQHAVTVNNEDDVVSLFDAWIVLPDNVDIESADHVVAGISGSLYSILGIDLQGYYKHYGSLISFNPEKIDASDPDYIGATGSSYGVETLLKFSSSDLDLMLSYALGWTSLTVEGLTYSPRYDRRHSLKALTAYRIASRFDISARWEYGSGLPFTPSLAYYNRIKYGDVFRNPVFIEPSDPYIALGRRNSSNLPPYHRMDLSASWWFEVGPLKCTVSGSIINAYDRKNLFYFDRQTGRRVNSLTLFPTAQLTLEYQ